MNLFARLLPCSTRRGRLETRLALVSLLPAILAVRAARDLVRHATQPQSLAPAIQLTIAAAALHGSLLAATMALARAFA